MVHSTCYKCELVKIKVIDGCGVSKWILVKFTGVYKCFWEQFSGKVYLLMF